MKWDVMDVRNMVKYKDAQFDLVIDKGTIDVFLCGNLAYMNAAIMLKECQRVLKTGGIYVAISYGKPDSRQDHFTREHLSFKLKTINVDREWPGGFKKTLYVYVCTKQQGSDKNHQDNYDQVLK